MLLYANLFKNIEKKAKFLHFWSKFDSVCLIYKDMSLTPSPTLYTDVCIFELTDNLRRFIQK